MAWNPGLETRLDVLDLAEGENMTRRVALETLGCKLNQYETDAIAAGFVRLGWTVVEPGAEAEAYIVNTCTVTNKADRKSRWTVNRNITLASSAPEPVVVVTGCYAESGRAVLEAQEGVTFVVPNARKNQIAALVDAHLQGEVAAPDLPPPDPFGFPVHPKIFHTRASLKIQDGCDNFCTFCIIPSVRGRAVSRPLNEVLEAARALIAGGRKELVLTGVNMGRWRDGELVFIDLVAALLDLPGEFRLRITSLEPDGLGEAFADLLTHPKMCPHLHLCLQSASPRVLLAMRREYNIEQYRALVALCRSRRPDLNLTTDIIVGFPGETEEDFATTKAAIAEFGFGFVHIFPYSRRQETRAERMSEQIDERVKRHRASELHDAMDEARTRYLDTLIGTTRTVLVETTDAPRSHGTWLRGLTEDYVPVRFTGTSPWNTLVTVVISGVAATADGPILEAQPVSVR
jgi:threonylcarbamoyladenosine tRNA methylthiotransferase MtaB